MLNISIQSVDFLLEILIFELHTEGILSSDGPAHLIFVSLECAHWTAFLKHGA